MLVPPLEWHEQHLTANEVATDLTRYTALGGFERRLQFEIDIPDDLDAPSTIAAGWNRDLPVELWLIDAERARARRLGNFPHFDGAKVSAKARHVEIVMARHYDLSWKEVRATRRAWPPIGLARFDGATPSMVQAEISRAIDPAHRRIG